MHSRLQFLRSILAAAALFGGAATAARGQMTVIYDSEFATSDWSITLVDSSGNGGSATAVQEVAGGNPNAYRRCILVINAGPGSAKYFHAFIASPYDPSVSGAAVLMNAYVDSRQLVPIPGQELFMAVRQNGLVYEAPLTSPSPGVIWSMKSFSGLTAFDFHEIGAPNSHPDFSASGKPFEVGFTTSNSTAGAGFLTECGYDNFRFVINPAPVVSYCTAGSSANGCLATLSSTGFSSASTPSGFDLIAANVEGAKVGFFLYGTGGRQANPWGAGPSFQCIASPVGRGTMMPGSGTPGQCDGSFAYDLNSRWATLPSHNPGPGAVVQAQLWYRDPFHPSGMTTSLSDALEFTVQP